MHGFIGFMHQHEFQGLQYKIFVYPSFRPDLSSSVHKLFLIPKLQEYFGGKQFTNDKELKEAVNYGSNI